MRTMQKFRESWEYRSVAFLLKIMAYVVLLVYLLSAAPNAWKWVKLKWVRLQPLSEISALADKSIAEKNPSLLTDWVLYRPKEERPEIMKRLEPYTGKISSFIFIHYAFWEMEAKRKEEAVFWRQYANYRFRFDALRCGTVDGEKFVSRLLESLRDKKVQAAQDENPSLDKKSILWALDKDAHYPAENYPVDICKLVNIRRNRKDGSLVPRENWAGLRHSLRLVTEMRLKEMKD